MPFAASRFALPLAAALASSLLASGLSACSQNPALRGLGAANAGGRASQVKPAVMPGELVVKFKTEAGKQALLQSLSLRALTRVERLDALVVKPERAAEALAKLQADPRVAYAEYNHVVRKFQAPATPALGFRAGDEMLGKLWGMTKIQAEKVWAQGIGDPKVRVAVVDTGIDHRHPDFGGRVEKGYDFINNDADAMDDEGHGTHCAGTVAAGLGNGGVVGVAPGVGLVAVKVLSASGSGSFAGVAKGVVYAADQGVEVISLSLGGGFPSQVLEDAVRYAIGKGCLVVAAMGNENTDDPSYPAASPGVMAVGATISNDLRASFSNYGQHISVAAPGGDIWSTKLGGGFESLSGTSMATPHVAGLAALLKSSAPQLDAKGLRQRIEASADDLGAQGFDPMFGHGRIRADRAVLGR